MSLCAEPRRAAVAGVVSIHQPHYFPWLGLIAKIASSDVFIFLDSVQFEKNGWQNRTRYSTSGGLKFLTLPVRQSGIVSGGKPIAEIELADTCAAQKHWQTLRQRYRKEPGWPRVADRLEAVLRREYDRLLPLALATTMLTLELFQVRPQTVLASELSVVGKKSERLVNLVKAVSGTHYLSGAGAREYLEPRLFGASGIGMSYQEFAHPLYPQLSGTPFMPGAFALEWFMAEPERAPARLQDLLKHSNSAKL